MPSAYLPWVLPSVVFNTATALVFQSRLVDAAAITYGLYLIIYFHLFPPTGPFLDNLQFGELLFSVASRTVNFLLIKDRNKDFVKRVDSNGKKGIRGPRVAGRSIWKRWLDALEVLLALRGASWAFQVTGVPPAKPPTYPRGRFIRENLVGVAWRFLAVDAGTTYIRSTPIGTLPIAKSLSQEPLYRGLVHAALIMIIVRWSMEMTNNLIAAMAVALGWGGPADWPPLLGSWADAWTVRRFWSRTWHQMMRTIAEPPVYWLLHDVLGIKKGTYLSNYGKVFGAFFVAYALHGYGSSMAGGSHVGDWNYFMSQAVAICFEETVVRLAMILGIGHVVGDRLARLIGYLWTGTFVVYSFMLWSDWAAAAGAYTADPFGFSIVRGLLDRSSRGNA